MPEKETVDGQPAEAEIPIAKPEEDGYLWIWKVCTVVVDWNLDTDCATERARIK